MAFTTINKHTDNMNAVTYSNAGDGAKAVTGFGHRPDLVWLKHRTVAMHHQLFNSVVGPTAGAMYPSYAAAIDTGYPLTSMDSDGFTTGSQSSNEGQNSANHVAWTWTAGGATPSKTYKVVVVSGKYRFRNSADSATFAEDHPTLDLQEGGTYTFDLSDSTLSSHPFKFSTTSNGTHGGGSEYTTGVATNLAPGNPGATVTLTLSASTPTLYYYCSSHSGMGGQINTNSTFGSSNFDGTVKSIVSANSTAGLSIVKMTVPSSGDFSYGHGLGSTPEFIILRGYNQGYNWDVFTTATGVGNRLKLNSTDASTSAANAFKTVDSTIIQQNVAHYAHNDTITAHCFKSIQGFSKMGSYAGNNSADGSFVFCGFAPKFIMVKRYGGGTQNWKMFDSARDNENPNDKGLNGNATTTEASGNAVDFLSNGFKFRSSDGDTNGYTDGYVFMAFGQSLVGTNNVPNTAR